MYYSYVEIEYVAMSFSPARMDLALKLLSEILYKLKMQKSDIWKVKYCYVWYNTC